MSDVFSTFRQWSGTASSNKPADTDVIGSGLADNLRTIQSVIRTYLASQSSTVVPSAGVADLSTATGHWVPVSGNSTVTGFGTEAAGIEYVVTFTGAPPLIHNSTSFQLPGAATVQASAGDVCVAESLGSGNWKIWGYTKQNGRAVIAGINQGVEQATTSGTAINFTSLPSGIKRITIMFKGVSTNGTSNLLVQIGGSSSGIETSGYSSRATDNTAGTTSNAGFAVTNGITATSVIHGAVVLDLENSSSFSWVSRGNLISSADSVWGMSAGSKSIGSELDRVRITTINGTDAFDAGAINLSYEF